MAIQTVSDLRTALKGISGATPILGLDKGDLTRDYQLYRITRVEVGSTGTGSNPPKTVFVEVVPK